MWVTGLVAHGLDIMGFRIVVFWGMVLISVVWDRLPMYGYGHASHRLRVRLSMCIEATSMDDP